MLKTKDTNPMHFFESFDAKKYCEGEAHDNQ